MQIEFPQYTGARCLMMPYVQGDPSSVPAEFEPYTDILRTMFFERGAVGYLTIDESEVAAGTAQRALRARFARAIHTEAGRMPNKLSCWGGGHWSSNTNVLLERKAQVLIANSIDASCAVWDAWHEDTSLDGDIGYAAGDYPYCGAELMRAGDVRRISIFTPHESLPITNGGKRQFLRIISSGVHGREPYFTINPLLG